MSGVFIKYKPTVVSSPDEPWRAVEVPKGCRVVDIVALLKKDDAFTSIYPIVKVLTADERLKGGSAVGASNGGLAEVGSVNMDNLSSASCFYITRSGGSAADYTTIIPGPIAGAIQTKASAHRFRVFNEAIEAYVSVDAVTNAGCQTSLMIESVPMGTISPAVTKMFKYSDHVDQKRAIDLHHTSTGHITEAALNSEWSQSPIPTDRAGLESGKWKSRIRKGVPSVHRHFVLPTLLERCASAGRQSLDDALKWTYGWSPSIDFFPEFSPTFAAQYVDSLKETVPLLPSGWLQHKYILTCLAQQQPDISVCPMLPAIVAYLLMVLSPNEAFATASKMMQLSRRETVSTIRYLPLSAESTASFVDSGIRIASNAGLAKAGLAPELLTVLFEDVGVAFFSQTFPPIYTLKIMDMYAYEGIKILIRIFVGILRVFLPKLGERDLTQFLVGGPSVENSLYSTCTQASFDHVVEEGFKLSLSKNDISWSGLKPPPGSLMNTKRELHHWPILAEGPLASKILGTTLRFYERIYVQFPISYSNIKRVFRASEDAWSVSSLYGKMANQLPSAALLVFQTANEHRIGLFTSEMPWKAGKAYVGSRMDFVFFIDANDEMSIYACATCTKENVLLCEKDYLTIGEGPAFRVSGDLQSATSSDCSVFGSPRFWDDEASIVEVEIFEIQ